MIFVVFLTEKTPELYLYFKYSKKLTSLQKNFMNLRKFKTISTSFDAQYNYIQTLLRAVSLIANFYYSKVGLR
jgi:hypothetical protein